MTVTEKVKLVTVLLVTVMLVTVMFVTVIVVTVMLVKVSVESHTTLTDKGNTTTLGQ